MKRVAIITARGGSKGLPDKNMLMVDGKPLLAYSIEAAIESGMFERIVLTTDSDEYIDFLSYYPIDFHRRPDHLASDTSSSYDALADVLQYDQWGACDYFVLLQPTSPQRTAEQTQAICRAFDEAFDSYDFMASVSGAHKPTVLTRPIGEDRTLRYFDIDYSSYRRQDYLPEYSPNGVFFIAKPQAYLEQKHFYGARSLAFFMDKSESGDIDGRDDFEEFYASRQRARRGEILLRETKRELELKHPYFSALGELSLVGDAHFAGWGVRSLAGMQVQNLAISPITTEQYLSLVLQEGLIQRLGREVLISLGANDLRSNLGSPEEIAQRIVAIAQRIRSLSPLSRVRVMEVPQTLFRIDCRTEDVTRLNTSLSEALKVAGIDFLEVNAGLVNRYGKLDRSYTNDGFHLNEAGYARLAQLLTPHFA